MQGRVVLIKSSAELTAIDGAILDTMSYGIDIHILKVNHMVCASDSVMFTNFIHNKETSRRAIFIPDTMENDMKIIENVYFTESRRNMSPCPQGCIKPGSLAV